MPSKRDRPALKGGFVLVWSSLIPVKPLSSLSIFHFNPTHGQLWLSCGDVPWGEKSLDNLGEDIDYRIGGIRPVTLRLVKKPANLIGAAAIGLRYTLLDVRLSRRDAGLFRHSIFTTHVGWYIGLEVRALWRSTGSWEGRTSTGPKWPIERLLGAALQKRRRTLYWIKECMNRISALRLQRMRRISSPAPSRCAP